MTEIPNFIDILAQSGGGQPGGAGGLFGSPIFMIGLLVVMFYFLLIRPQQKQRKEQENRINSMQPGDRVVTAGGVHGLIHNIKDRTVVVKVAEGTMIEFEKGSIASVIKKESRRESKD
jgi:preprotein translocase subunit YajC